MENDLSWHGDYVLSPREEEEAMYFYKKAKMLQNKNKLKDAIALYREASKVGFERADYAEAHYELGLIYLGKSDKAFTDLPKAVSWIENAACSGHLEAQKLLGRLFERGEGVERDIAKALRWYERAAERGDKTTQKMLANMYQSGAGTAQECAKAFYWCAWLAARDDRDAMLALARMHEAGEGILTDTAHAERWRNAANESTAAGVSK